MHPPINWTNKIKDSEISLGNTTYICPRKRPHRRTVTDPPSKRNTCWKADYIATSNMADAVLLTRLRSGRTPLLKAYVHLLDPAASPTCPLCKAEPQTLKHWLQRLSNLDALRQHTFGSPSPLLQPNPMRCWRSQGPTSTALGARRNNNNNNICLVWLNKYLILMNIYFY